MERWSIAGIGAAVLVASMLCSYLAFGQKATRVQSNRVAKPSAQMGNENKAKVIAAQNELYGFKGVIAGTVRFGDGRPASGYRVVARFPEFNTGQVGDNYAFTDEQGKYRIQGLASAQFHVEVDNGRAPFIATMPFQKVRASSKQPVENIDFELEPGPEVTVRVRDAETGAPVAGLSILPRQPWQAANKSIGVTNAKGEFLYRSASRVVQVYLDNRAAQPRVYDAAPGYSFHFVRRMKPGQKTVWNTKAYADPTEVKPVLFRVQVNDTHGNPLPRVKATILQESGAVRAFTDGSGWFATKIDRILPRDNQNGTVLVLEKDGRETVRYLSGEDTWNVLRITWNPPAPTLVTGQVKDNRGRPLADVPLKYDVQFRNADNRPTYTMEYRRDSGVLHTGTNGRFALPVHPEAVYRFEFGDIYYQNLRFNRVEVPAVRGMFIRPEPGKTRNLGVITVQERMGAARQHARAR